MSDEATQDTPILKVPRLSRGPKIAVLTPGLTISRLMRNTIDRRGSRTALSSRGYLADCIPWYSGGIVGMAGPLLGASAAVIAAEPLIKSGAEVLMLLGVAGGLPKNEQKISVGDVALPGYGLSEEGTSRLYGAEDCIQPWDTALQSKLNEDLEKNWGSEGLFETGVWTTDAPYRESPEKVRHFQALGAGAVEMEYCALLQLANLYQVHFAAAFVVSDILGDDWDSQFGSSRVKKRLSDCATTMADLISAIQ